MNDENFMPLETIQAENVSGQKKINLDTFDVSILSMIMDNKSLEEMGSKIGKGTSFVQSRVDRMAKHGFVNKPKEKKARSLRLTELGKAELKASGAATRYRE